MKKKVFVCLAVMCVAVANFIVGMNTPTESEDLMLQNIETVGLSASETTCDSSTVNDCEINGVGKATGRLIHNN